MNLDKTQKGKRSAENPISENDNSKIMIKNNDKLRMDSVQHVLADSSFQREILKSDTATEFFQNIRESEPNNSIKIFNNRINNDIIKKNHFDRKSKIVASFSHDGGKDWLRLDVILKSEEDKTEKCAHLYFQFVENLSDCTNYTFNNNNSCATCTLQQADNTAIVISGLKIKLGLETHTNVVRTATEEDKENDAIDKFLENNSNDVTYNNGKSMVTIPTSLYNTITAIIKQQSDMRKELNEYKQMIEKYAHNTGETSKKTNDSRRMSVTSIESNNPNELNVNDFRKPQKVTNTHITTFKKNKTVPPIFVDTEKYNEKMLLQMIEEAEIGKETIKFFPATNKQVRIQVNNLENYDKINILLKQREVNLHTHAIKERIKPVYIIKNLCKNFELEDIENDLKLQNFETEQITRFETKFHKENNIDSKMVKVALPENTDTKAFEKIKFILNMRVYIQTLKPSLVLQCKRCQRVGHTANYCTYPYRCVKCIEQHPPGQCKLNAPGNTCKPKCCNCGGEHIASSYTCKFLSSVIEKRKENKTKDNTKIFKTNQIISKTINNNPTNRNTYANIIKSNKQHNNPKTEVLTQLNNCIQALQESINKLFSNNG